MTPSEIETATFWLVAQYLNQLRCCVPHTLEVSDIKLKFPRVPMFVNLCLPASFITGTQTRVFLCQEHLLFPFTFLESITHCVIVNKLTTRESFELPSALKFYSLQKYYLKKSYIFFSIFYPTSFQGPYSSDFGPASHFRV